MSLSTTPLWSEEQREWLQALGHDVLALASTAPAPMPMPQAGDAGVEAREASGPAVRAPARSPAALPDSPLLRALARAAGRAPQDPDLLAALPDLSLLRRDPRARRALWPKLRALRPRRRR